MPRFLLGVVVVLSVLYAGYWFVGREVLARGIARLEAEASEQGVDLTYVDLHIRGFPSRFDTTLMAPEVRSADGRVSWAAPFFQAFMLSYQPGRFILIWPNDQRLDLAGAAYDAASVDMRASLAVGLTPDAPVNAATLETGAVTVTGPSGDVISWARGLAALRDDKVSEPGHPYDLFAEATGIDHPTLGTGLSVRFDGTGMFDGPIDRHALNGLPRLTVLAVRDLSIRGNGLLVSATGTLSVNAAGELNGALDLVLPDPPTALARALEAGLLTTGQANLIGSAFEAIAADDGGVTLPLTFENGIAAVAGISLGIVPRLW